jgi:argininosuccinate synthase
VLPVTAALPSCLRFGPVLQDDLMPKYAELVYNGFWFSPEREALQALVDKTQEFVTGTVRLKLYKVSGTNRQGAVRHTVR